jgi:hypothetical protein
MKYNNARCKSRQKQLLLSDALGYNGCMALQIVVWWYGAGWRQASRTIFTWLAGIQQMFSVAQISRTLFAPWRRITSYGGRSLDEKLRGAIDDLVSRVVGFFVRIFVLIAALVAMLFVICFGAIITVLWPVLPVIGIYGIVRGIIG